MQELVNISGHDGVGMGVRKRHRSRWKLHWTWLLVERGRGEGRQSTAGLAGYPKHPAKLDGKALMPTHTKCVVCNLEFEVLLTPRPQGLPVINFS